MHSTTTAVTAGDEEPARNNGGDASGSVAARQFLQECSRVHEVRRGDELRVVQGEIAFYLFAMVNEVHACVVSLVILFSPAMKREGCEIRAQLRMLRFL